MKAKLTTLTLIALVGAAGTTAALAHDDYSESSMFHNLSHAAQSKGMQGRPAERTPAPFVDYGEGTSLLTINQSVKQSGSPSTAVRTGHSEYEEGTSTFHAGHADQR